MNYYELLGVSQDADEADIKSAANTMLRGVHPDKTGTDATSHLVSMVKQARSTLTNQSSRETYDISLTEKSQNDSPTPTVNSPSLHAMSGMLQGYLFDKIVTWLNREHNKKVDTSNGTIAVSPTTMLFGGKSGSGDATWTIPAKSSLGDSINVYVDGVVVDTPTLTLAPPKEGTFYANGLVWIIVFTEGDQMFQGGRFAFTLSGNHSINIDIPPGSSIMSVVECDDYNVIVTDSRIHDYMDEDMVMPIRRLLDGV